MQMNKKNARKIKKEKTKQCKILDIQVARLTAWVEFSKLIGAAVWCEPLKLHFRQIDG